MDHPPGFTPKSGKGLQIEEGFIWIGAITKCMVWFGIFSHLMKKYGFKQAMTNHTLFYKRVGTDITLLIVYVDDMVDT
ncbi:reverse transcriptase, partial [Trifolium medium]|nr:reverse transcriptase [Trifolium medium]